ncbi:daunorubicin resistance ABC transporter ATP-binding subunit [Saccharomonospora amisosensis]|uniref:Daunorubicin resistance ABC transporter ATP-binding subunit n=1 Tax=Saccharomonospora amisosensis TaxID=1128677 RepID=A0A7X5UST2_9PSEU|nr:ATP-binding cassette domain-containing protein [Saccharomonospora amisosensis]NIJ13033.1 daunorubicin resistance ABC transporter ATP-binding subunit [Saccharomonospora amisosensis]
MGDAILAEDLRKRFGNFVSLDGLSLRVEEGSVLGLLGPNGAGKTTAVRILTTLLQPDSGRAEVAGFDVLTAPRRVRSLIGLTGQFAAVDELLTGAENLELVGRLARLTRADARRRACELLERLDLGEVAGRQVGTYSGGTRRRLDLAASIISRPRVLFLDEPTVGLDLPSRLNMWSVIDELVWDGMTVLLTTQYLEEADRLSNQVTVINEGKVVVAGTPEELKARVAGRHAVARLADPAQLPAAAAAIRAAGGQTEPVTDADTATVSVALGPAGDEAIPGMLAAVHNAGVQVADFAVRQPTLDDVFLSVTGTSAAETAKVTANGEESR